MVSTEAVSWLIPVRDGAATLGVAVRSALDECGPADEVVVVDDGSCDAPASVLPADPRVHLLVQPPAGIVAALEAGRARCRGTLIARLDADDRALPGRIAAQRAALAADPSLAAVGGRARVHRDEGAVPEGMDRYVAWVNGLTDRQALARNVLVESPLFHPATTLRAAALAQVGGWRAGDLPEDYDLWLRLVAAGWGLCNVPVEVVDIADRPARLTRTDPRYRRAAFTALKQAHLAQTRLREPARVGLWGAGRTGRPWLRWLRAEGHEVCVLVDAFARGERQGLAVSAPEALVGQDLDLLLVAVGARGARDEIRVRLARLRPDLVEGVGWLALS